MVEVENIEGKSGFLQLPPLGLNCHEECLRVSWIYWEQEDQGKDTAHPSVDANSKVDHYLHCLPLA